MPELPEVHALVEDLGARLCGRRVDRLRVVSFAALKTFNPPISAIDGALVSGVSRHGKFLDFSIGDLHLARAGWIRWRNEAPQPSKSLGKGPMAARVVLDPSTGSGQAIGSGIDITEAGTKKSLAIYLVRSPREDVAVHASVDVGG